MSEGGPRELPPAPAGGAFHRPRRPWRDVLFTTVVALLAFVIGLMVFNGVLMPRLIHREGEVRVPDLVNLTIAQAQKELLPTGLPLSQAGERFDPNVPRGRIVQQDPAAGTPVRGRRRVAVTVSLGEEFSSVPALFGETRRGAELLLEQSGLRVGGITRAPSDAVGEGLVVATDPPAESVLPRGGDVALLVSSGLGDEVYVMPDLVGREIGRARKQLEALGFRVLTPPAGPSMGPIVAQDPPAGVRLTRDMSITLQAGGRLVR
jgi:serine/threonine-protein kinase